MKNEKTVEFNITEREDELRPEYEETLLKGLLKNGVRGKYVERYRQGTNLVKLPRMSPLLESGSVGALSPD